MEKWIIRGGKSLPFMQRYQLHPLMARILASRISLDQTNEYLDRKAPLFSPWQMADMQEAVRLIRLHLKKQNRIRIIGDYDVDGLTSTSILFQGLTALGYDAAVSCRIPERIGEGYGFSLPIAEEMRRDAIDLVITCDNGIREMESAAFLKEQGIDLIITDHHEIALTETGQELLPEADAILNPHRKGDQSPQSSICGAFVAFQLIQALYQAEGKTPPAHLIGYAALGTICDVMPLLQENRRLVYQGLEELNRRPTTGLSALMEAGGIQRITPYTAGYIIGPMLNAGGRLGSQNRYLQLLLSEDPAECRQLAGELYALNRERQQMTEIGLQQGAEQMEQYLAEDPVKVVYLPDLHESIAGLVAGKLKERCQHPVFVLTKGETGLKGSGRSIPAYSMFEEMNQAAHLFRKFGGHPMAAGLSMDCVEGKEEDAVLALRSALNQNCSLTEEDCAEIVYIDAVMPVHQLSVSLVQMMDGLEPCGTGNPRPMLAQKGLLLKRCQIFGKKRNVMRLTLVSEGQAVEAVCFRTEVVEELVLQHSGESAIQEINSGKYLSRPIAVDIVYQPEIDTFTGTAKVKIMVKYIRFSN